MSYLLPDKIRDEKDQLRLWLKILRPFDRRPMSPAMQQAVVAREQNRRLGEERVA